MKKLLLTIFLCLPLVTSAQQFIPFLKWNNATGTSATTTSFFSTIASSTNLFSTVAAFGTMSGTLSTAAQPNITSLGTLTGLTVNSSSVTLSQDTNFVLSGLVNGVSFDGTTLSVDALSDRVGFGTSSPAYALELTSASNAWFNTDRPNTGQIAWHSFGTNSTLNWGMGLVNSTADFSFLDYSTVSFPLTLKAGGSIGIGTTSPWRTFDVLGTVGMKGLTGSAGLQVGILCLSANNEVINESVACVASAARYKEKVRDLNVGLDEVLKLRPVTFYWKPSFNGALKNDPNKSGVQYSLIADEAQRVDPNLVYVQTSTTTFEGKTYGPGTVEGLADSNHWVALFVKAFQDVAVRILGSEKRMSDQQKQLDVQSLQIQILAKRLEILEKK